MWKRIATCVLVAGLAPGARAGDGVIEINQDKALAGAVTPGDGAGFPVLITKSGSYRLTSSLSAPSGVNGITIAAPDVTLDLGGFAVEGPYVCCSGSGTGSGIQANAVRATVSNGRVLGFAGSGVSLGTLAHVERVVVSQAGSHGLELGGGSLALENRVTGVGESGLRFTGTVPGLFRDNVLTSVAQNPGSTALAFAGLAHATGGNYCADRSCSRRGARRYYLGRTLLAGQTLLLAGTQLCDAGFHFASLQELRDPTALEWDASRGAVVTDVDSSVGGPPTTLWGWVRTGYTPNGLSGLDPGEHNCHGWVLNLGGSQGARARLSSRWNDPALRAGFWETDYEFCSPQGASRVWCVED